MTSKFKLSRYYNRFAFFIINLGIKLIWDETERNKDILGFMQKEVNDCNEMLTNRDLTK